MKKIVLLGYMGSGKSTVGEKLSSLLNIPFQDLDILIEKTEGMTISNIFSSKGEIYFRKKEHQIFKEVLAHKENMILSLGGGTPCYAQNHLLLQQEDVCSIYLKAKVSTLVKRLENQKENRPLLHTTDDLASYIGPHLFERVYYYNFTKHTISTDDKTVDEICQEILTLI